jgi:hypothetical protein
VSLLETYLKHAGPGAFTGATLGDWFRVLRRCRSSIDPPYWIRAVAITGNAIPNTLVAHVESWRHGRAIDRTRVERPLFILGIWRSGTTHLHNLLASDRRFGFANAFQVMNPHTFLLTERTYAPLLNLFFPKTRPQDNVPMAASVPQEDEFALACCGQSFLLSLAFPRKAQDYDRLLTLRRANKAERNEWKAKFFWFIKKLAYLHQRPLVLKSPGHTARIRLLLELFPDARFVHIRRNPYEVYQSTQHTLQKIVPWWTLQRQSTDDLERRILAQYNEVYEVYFEERPLIPDHRFCEISFEALERDTIGQLRYIYDSLDFPDFSDVEPVLQSYVESLATYRKNKFTVLPDQQRARIAHAWRRCFDAWGYHP